MDNTWVTKKHKDLFNAIVKLKNTDEVQMFLRDLLTIKELDTFSSRWQTAMLLEQRAPYTEIEKMTGLSSATIARVNQYREYGTGGYRLVLDRLKES